MSSVVGEGIEEAAQGPPLPSLYLPVSSLSIEGGILSESQLVC